MPRTPTAVRDLLLPAPPGSNPVGREAARADVMAVLPDPGPYRFTLLDAQVGSRDAVALLHDAVGRTLQAVPAAARMALVASFREPVADPALFDALVWGQVQALLQLDRLRYPRVASGQPDTVSLAGRCTRVTAWHAQAAPASRRAPYDTLVLVFAPAGLDGAVTGGSPAP